MKKEWMVGVIVLVVVIIAVFYFQLTGRVSNSIGGPEFTGPTQAQISCMETCSGCIYGNTTCMEQHSSRCGAECGVETNGPPEPADEGEACMQKCVAVGCDDFDFSCQQMNKAGCEDECNMKGDAPDESEMSAEQLCISNCVAKEDPEMICGNSKEGETGGALCQKCADECVHLYEGPCLNDEQLTQKEKECETCEHCYGEPVIGTSGEGWDCIVDVECRDASSEFGDEPGEGPGIGQEGYVAPNVVAGTIDGIIKFFKGLFGSGKEE
ncbi:MAG: hypothetical protein KKF67_02615 [Nanoarchaeota archaeon]|nr:hypothetical protein [Nanoarchaeota archaeon]